MKWAPPLCRHGNVVPAPCRHGHAEPCLRWVTMTVMLWYLGQIGAMACTLQAVRYKYKYKHI